MNNLKINSVSIPMGLLVSTSIVLLIYGVWGYLSLRAASDVYFLTLFEMPQIFQQMPSPLIWNDHLPSLIHIVAFSSFTLAVLGITLFRAVAIPLLWAAINIFFEIGQHNIVKDFVSHFEGNDRLPHFILNYSLRGTFDWFDILYTLAGAGITTTGVLLLIKHQSGAAAETGIIS
jgi:hypothetical protein